MLLPKRPEKSSSPNIREENQLTVVRCANAEGQMILPRIIFDAKTLNPEWTKGELSGTYCGLSGKGRIDQKLFSGWLGHFQKHAAAARPLLLLLDGHSSHHEPNSLQHVKDHNDIMFACLHYYSQFPAFGCECLWPLETILEGGVPQLHTKEPWAINHEV